MSLSAEITDKKMNLTCDVTGYPKPEVLWYKNGTKVISSKRNYLKIHHITVNWQRYKSFLHKKYPDKTDNGKYTCKAKNEYGENSATESLTCIGCKWLSVHVH